MKKKRQQFYRIGFILLILAAIICLLVIMIKTRFDESKEKEGIFIQKEDAYLLFGYLCTNKEEIAKKELDVLKLQEAVISGLSVRDTGEEALTKAEAMYMFDVLKELYPLYEGDILKQKEQAYLDYKRDKARILSTDFMKEYELLWGLLHSGLPLEKRDIILLGYGGDAQILNEDISGFEEFGDREFGYLKSADLSQNPDIQKAVFAKSCPVFENSILDMLYQNRCFLMCGDVALWDCSSYQMLDSKDFTLEAAFIVSNLPDALLVETGDYRFVLHNGGKQIKTVQGEDYSSFENVADIYFKDGRLSALDIYDTYVSGRLLCIQDDSVELEGAGVFPYTGRFPVYKLYGEKEYYTKNDLKIGYDFTDFVLNRDGRIVAGLVTREEAMENIRVVIKTSGFAGAYHESITLCCNQDFLVNDEKHRAYEELTFSAEDKIFDKGRVYIRPETNLAQTTLKSVERSQGTPSYRGNFEIMKTQDGLVLINELLLEEYLYSVVPSEMPSSYPSEALKAQAICARTYAYDKMCHSSLQSYGAHVDDSAAFQVYNNINEGEAATLAIRETQGQILTVNGFPAETYYYSTSCGYGTDIDAWHSSEADSYRYMVARHLSDEKDGKTAEDMTDEAVFRDYILKTNEQDFESEEGWYRWTYDTVLNIDRLNQNLLKRYEAGSKNVVTLNDSQEYEQMTPPVFTSVNRMEIIKRESGGVMDELLFSGPEGTVKVIGEHNIRAVLANETDHVVRVNGSNGTVSGLLPSAFASLDVTVDEATNTVKAYHMNGGGFGHGIGMSQNGARSMAQRGWSCSDILEFFFENTLVEALDAVQ